MFFRFKRLVLGIIAALIVAVISLIVWFILPTEQMATTQLIPKETFAFVSLDVRMDDLGIYNLINDLTIDSRETGLRNRDRFLIKHVIPHLLPLEVAAVAVSNSEGQDPGYTIMVKNSKVVKATRLFRGLLMDKIKKRYTYADAKDIIIISAKPTLVKLSMDQRGREVNFISGDMLDDFCQLREKGEAIFFISNAGFELSQLMKEFERKNSYTLLLTADSIEWLGGWLDLLDGDSVEGDFIFKYKEITNFEDVMEDVYFLVGILKRLCKANDLNFAHELKISGDRLDLNFKISGLRLFIADLLATEVEREGG